MLRSLSLAPPPGANNSAIPSLLAAVGALGGAVGAGMVLNGTFSFSELLQKKCQQLPVPSQTIFSAALQGEETLAGLAEYIPEVADVVNDELLDLVRKIAQLQNEFQVRKELDDTNLDTLNKEFCNLVDVSFLCCTCSVCVCLSLLHLCLISPLPFLFIALSLFLFCFSYVSLLFLLCFSFVSLFSARHWRC